MIRSFRHKALKQFWDTGATRGLNANWIDRVSLILDLLDTADIPEDMNIAGLDFHALSGNYAGRYAVSVNRNWRITFAFEEADATLVDLEDYH